MEGVVGILLTARRLLDAGELCYVSEHVRAVHNYFLLEGASGFVVAQDDLIKNFLDIHVVFVRLTVRSQIRGIGIFWAQSDEYARCFITAHNTDVRRKRTTEI